MIEPTLIFEHAHSLKLMVTLGVAIALLYWTIYQHVVTLSLQRIPRVGKDPGWFGLDLAAAKKEFAKNGRQLLYDGYIKASKYRNGLYRVQNLNVERVVLTPKYIEEITRNVPDGVLDMTDGLKERLLSSQTNLDIVFNSSLHIDVCKSQLTHNLHPLIKPLNDEATYWLSKRIPCETQIRAYEVMVRIISATASLMLGGKTISRNEEWLETAAEYSMDVVRVAMALRPWPAFVRPLLFPCLPGAKLLEKHLAITKKCFKPMFVERLAQVQSKQQAEKSVDMVQWMTESAEGSDRDPNVLAHNMLFMALAGVHTSSATTVNVLFDLCARPEYVGPLRKEIATTVKEHGWTLASISRMKKLDSFIKESLRLNQAFLMTFNRRVSKTLRLRDGTIFPRGTYLTMPSDSVARDPGLYPNPDEFDGYRFFDKRMSDKAEANRHQFAPVGPESLAFGQGKQACPGRFFAGAQIKVVIANILLNYDISFPAGQTERPKNIYIRMAWCDRIRGRAWCSCRRRRRVLNVYERGSIDLRNIPSDATVCPNPSIAAIINCDVGPMKEWYIPSSSRKARQVVCTIPTPAYPIEHVRHKFSLFPDQFHQLRALLDRSERRQPPSCSLDCLHS
ncbi:cytochrome P450 [Teratosphaeria nubilosa]|uniref:Cytochrome P450 n=1 Tax=Teratosphaeria nubilosa TaxID=161662 RepID=A0A6G1KTS8_9PEZI|nr:cytochrome P450 [Teratosphaeria nubilosa]